MILKVALLILMLGILALCLAVALAGNRFNRMVAGEVDRLFSDLKFNNLPPVQQSDLDSLPLPVQKWLMASGIVGKIATQTVRLKQTGAMRSKPDGSWMSIAAEQYFIVSKPAFIWKAKVKVAPLLSLVARDKYVDGRGNMLIKLLALFKIADSKGQEIDQGSMLRYLAETIWFPTAALSSYNHWEPIDSLSARATMTNGGITASGTFHFNERGDVTAFEAKRYGEFNGQYSLETWYITMTGYRSFEGVRIPNASEVMWKLKTGDFTWLKLEITDLEYNQPKRY
jgi:hypothetical protein